MNAFTLKLIAVVTMLIDHMGAVMPELFGFHYRVIGRISFPIFVFLIAEGFRHTKNPRGFMIRLGVFAIVSQPVFAFAIFGIDGIRGISFIQNTNIFYTLFLGGAAILCYNNIKKKILAVIPLLGFMLIAELLTTDYGAYGVVFIFCMYVIRVKWLRLTAMAICCVWQHLWLFSFAFSWETEYYGSPVLYFMMIPSTLFAVLLVAFYNGKRGWGLKWLFYVFYPLHLAALLLLRMLMI